ncbi:MAG TPA: amidase [Stellaceae bacterium]|nr:amidase [Stellaceae bacterium]
MENHAFASATQLSGEIRDRKIGCLELLDFFLARADKFNPKLNAIIAWQIDKARDRARAADAALARGQSWGPLHGLPMTVKESFNVAGLPTTFGNPAWKDNIPPSNAVVVDRLEAAGAVIYGKTNVPYMLQDSQSYNDIYGTTNNPWALDCGPGGSSGGEAATLAAGLSALGAGSDIAGSLRNPAYYCGIYGHKPSWGLIPTRGHGPPGVVTPTDISVVGPMARHAEDLALALDVLAGPDVLQQSAWRVALPAPRAKRLADFRVAVCLSSPMTPIEDSVMTAMEAAVAAIAKAGATVDRDAKLPVTLEDNQRLFMLLLRAATASRLTDAAFVEQQEIAAALSPDDMSPEAHIARGATMLHRAWGQANEQRSKLRYQWLEFFKNYDVVIAPVAATAAFPHDHNPDRGARRVIVNGAPSQHIDIIWAGLAALSYLPATAAPVGLTPTGLPVGVQIIGAEGEDPTTIEFARLMAQEIGGSVAPPGCE